MTQTRDQHRLEAVKRFNKKVLNPVMLTVAGRRYWYASVLHTTGRRTSHVHLTPVVAEPVPGGFVVPLPYGTAVDWLRNLEAAGTATLDIHGRHLTVGQPLVIDAAEALPLVRPSRRRVWRRLGIAQFLQVTTLSPA
ncbi:PNPOx family protein [Actinoplanes awajinensis]|uniref:Nitroreductase n=1 Tax=Actinoplanes awajinensis subsp. mycoplanecinus TaxID=135947 RepID=A0A124G7S2_9ACTN|nr:nitroreductase [Actinoplanes awajinensis]KUL23620.1 nitroreductase [Actinoplanes awajinensis subsp. mycoplanecinus]